MIVSYAELAGTLERAFAAAGLEPDRARRGAQLIADSTRDGVPSHGLTLFPRVVSMIRSGAIDPRARAVRVAGHGALERWDGRRGVGALNAYDAMGAAIARARESGVACVALGNTNHWMRGGSYGWQAADAGTIALCWTNTLPNLPPWGAATPRIGNNPLVVAVPRARGERLPVAGGYDRDGRLTDDPAAIEESRRPLPIGFWKGSGLSIVLDIIAAALAGGLATHEIGADPERETGLSQVFIAIDPASLAGGEVDRIADAVIASVQARYPGERALAARRQHMYDGIDVDDEAWAFTVRLAG